MALRSVMGPSPSATVTMWGIAGTFVLGGAVVAAAGGGIACTGLGLPVGAGAVVAGATLAAIGIGMGIVAEKVGEIESGISLWDIPFIDR